MVKNKKMVLEDNETLEVNLHGLTIKKGFHWSEFVLNGKVRLITYGENRDDEKEIKKLLFNSNTTERIEQIKKLIQGSESTETKDFTLGERVMKSVIKDLKSLSNEYKYLLDDVQIKLHYEYLIETDELERSRKEIRSFLNDSIHKRYSQVKQRDIKNIDSLFFCENRAIALKRFWQMEEYLQNIFNKFNEIQKRNKYSAICYIIDEQYKIHKNIIEENICELLLRFEINYIIYEVIEIKLKEFSSTDTQQVKNFLQFKENRFKPLKWNSKKSAIGTLFGVLHQEGIIQGSKADLARELANMFGNLSESTLIDNIGLKEDKENYKPKYDTETQELMSKWVTFLKSCTPKQG